MAELPFILPGNPASSSQALSAVSVDSGQLTDSTRPIWIHFRLAEGNERTFHPINLKNGQISNKRLHYCLLCEERRAPTIWRNAFVQNAKNHVQKQHPEYWRRWNQGNNAVAATSSNSSQKTLNSFLQPVLLPQAERVVLQGAYNKERHIQAMIALCSRRRLALSAADWPELRELIYRLIQQSIT